MISILNILLNSFKLSRMTNLTWEQLTIHKLAMNIFRSMGVLATHLYTFSNCRSKSAVSCKTKDIHVSRTTE